jgi:putative ABC transport system permease protein
MADIDRDRPITEVRQLADTIDGVLSSDRYAVTVVSLFAGVATVLAAVGLYGVMSFTVGQRTREIGVRMALGATHADVLGLVMRRVLVATGLGVAFGVIGALLLTKFVARLLWGISPTDASTFVVVSMAMTLIALLAGWIPARRALRVAPTLALRTE